VAAVVVAEEEIAGAVAAVAAEKAVAAAEIATVGRICNTNCY
jgi:hypothetical protein